MACDFITEDNRDAAIAYLEEHPGNYSGCAKHLGLTREMFVSLRSHYYSDFHECSEAYLDNIQMLCMKDAAGKNTNKDFSFNKAFKLLERLRSDKFGSSSKVVHEKKNKPQRSTAQQGRTKKRLDDYAEQAGIPIPNVTRPH